MDHPKTGIWFSIPIKFPGAKRPFPLTPGHHLCRAATIGWQSPNTKGFILLTDGISSGYFIIIAVVVKMFTRAVIYKSGSEKFLPTPFLNLREGSLKNWKAGQKISFSSAKLFLEISLSWMFCKDFTLLDQMLLNAILCLSYSQRMCEGKKSILDKL